MNPTIEFLHEHLEYRDGFLYWKKRTGKKGHIYPGKLAGGKHPLGYWTVGICGKRHYAHRVIVAMHTGEFPDMVDHINGNGLDNRIENLRACTKSQNMMNMATPKHNTSGFKGVGWSKQMNKWRAHISLDGKLMHLGYFDDIEAAKNIVAKKRCEMHKDFSRHS